jgi:hypothetical protein
LLGCLLLLVGQESSLGACVVELMPTSLGHFGSPGSKSLHVYELSSTRILHVYELSSTKISSRKCDKPL